MKIIVNGIKIMTDSYTGNFEREMTAYCTGHIGDCEVGIEEANEYAIDYSLADRVDQIPDGHGTYRPVVMDNNADNLIIVFEDDYIIPENEIDFIFMRAIEYGKKNDIEILGVDSGEFILKR
jgi:hypothetical protein